MKQFLRRLILLLVRVVGAPGALAHVGTGRQRVGRSPRLLLLRPDHLGDLVLTTPVLQALRKQAPDASITMMVGPWSSAIVARHPAIDRLLTCSFPGFQRAPQRALAPYILLFRTARQLRHGHYDLAINLRPDFWWGAALLYLAGIPRRVGYAVPPGQPFLTDALPLQTPEHATVSSLSLANAALRSLGYPALIEPYTPEQYPLHFVPTPQEEQWVTARLRQAGIAAETPLVVIHPGTGAAVKQWRPEAWAHRADALAPSSFFPQPPALVLTGNPAERPLLEEIAQKMNSQPLLVTDASVGQLAALLKRAHLVLGVDNGPLHLAVAQGSPTLAIFGPTDPRIFGPWGPPQHHLVIASTHRCPSCPTIPCGRLDFPPADLAQHPCVRLVPEKRVEEAIERLSSLRLRNS